MDLIKVWSSIQSGEKVKEATLYESSYDHIVFSLDKYPYVFKVIGRRELPDRLQNTETAQKLLKNSAY